MLWTPNRMYHHLYTATSKTEGNANFTDGVNNRKIVRSGVFIRIIPVWDQIITSSLSMMKEMSPALEPQTFILSYSLVILFGWNNLIRALRKYHGSHRTFRFEFLTRTTPRLPLLLSGTLWAQCWMKRKWHGYAGHVRTPFDPEIIRVLKKKTVPRAFGLDLLYLHAF